MIFNRIVADIFPEERVAVTPNAKLAEAVSEEASRRDLILVPDWAVRIQMFFEQWSVRHGLCIMGPVGSGKTTMLTLLQQGVFRTTSLPCRVYRMNPKALLAAQMFGSFDSKTSDWADGVLVSLWRKATRRKMDNNWIIMDGPVDSMWIENLNSVLDDTKVLTLANGDRLPLPPTVRLIFETDSLEHASPATVSRLGLVYLSAACLGWEPLVSGWVSKVLHKLSVPRDVVDLVAVTIRSHFESFLQHVAQSPSLAAQSGNAAMLAIANVLRVAEAIMVSVSAARTMLVHEAHRVAAFALLWGCGSLLHSVSDFGRLANAAQANSTLDYCRERGGVASFFLDSQGSWKRWEELIPATEKVLGESVVVSTEVCRAHYMMNMYAAAHAPFLVMGDAGTGKTMLVQAYLSRLPSPLLARQLTTSYATSVVSLQKSVLGVLDRSGSSAWGPPSGHVMLIFIDDIHLSEVSQWKSQPTNELLRQMMEDAGSFLLQHQSVEWAALANTLFCASMKTVDGGSNSIPHRLKRHFAVVHVPPPDGEAVVTMYAVLFRRYFSEKHGFLTEVTRCANDVGEIMHAVLDACCTKLRPTPLSFHYQFNLKDLSRVFDGLRLATPEVVASVGALGQLLRNELLCAFGDKLISASEVRWLATSVDARLSEQLKVPVAELSCPDKLWSVLRPAKNDGQKDLPIIASYQAVPASALKQAFSDRHDVYNENNRKSPLSLVWSGFFIQCLSRVVRVLSTKRGSMTLLGVGGSGKCSLARMGAYATQARIVMLRTNAQYTFANLMDEVKENFKAALNGCSVAFILSDNDPISSSVLEFVSVLLSSGELPSVFSKEELELLFEEVRATCGTESASSAFVSRVRDNCHVLCCFSPTGTELRQTVRQFPCLVQSSTVLWVPPWPGEALSETAHTILKRTQFGSSGPQDEESQLHSSQACSLVHQLAHEMAGACRSQTRKRVYVTPKNFLDFLAASGSVYHGHLRNMQETQKSVDGGLKRMTEAQTGVREMRITLGEKQRSLRDASKALDVMLKDIEQRSAAAEAATREIESVRNRLSVDAANVAAEKESADKDMEAALPTLREAEEALRTINADDISAVKKFITPPVMVRRIMDGVLVLCRAPMDAPAMEVDPTSGQKIIRPSWGAAKQMIADMGFLQMLLSFDKDSVTEEQVELLTPYLMQEDFTVERARVACGSLAGLCTWIRSMVTYFHIARSIHPKRARVRTAEESLFKASIALKRAEEQLAVQSAELQTIKAKYAEATAEKMRLEEDTESTRRRLTTAEQLILGLETELHRWKSLSAQSEKKILCLTGDAIVCGAFLSYCSPLDVHAAQRIPGLDC